jgi:hypothetical protein
MSLPSRRSIKLLPAIRQNSGKRGVATSIGVRGARVRFGKGSTRATVGQPRSGPSYADTESSRIVGFDAPASNPSLDADAPADEAWRGWLWIALIVFEIAAAVVQAMK